MKNYILYGLSLFGLYACNAGGTATPSSCPTNAPMFSSELGEHLINKWGESAIFYSPYGASGYADPYIGAAYFTGIKYTNDAVLLPTVSPVTRSGSQEIYDYFTKFLAHGPQMVNNPKSPESGGPFITQASCGYGVQSGYYNFTYRDGTTSTTARYTFQFQYQPTPSTVSITIESGSMFESKITIIQPVGWYIKLQNSAKLPSSRGLPNNLLIK